MGLDTVELVVEFEQYFQIDIPNRVAENISTVQDAAAEITRLKNLLPDPARTSVYYSLLARLLDCLHPLHPDVTEATLLTEFSLLNSSTEQARIAACLNLVMPNLPYSSPKPNLPGWWQRLFGAAETAPAIPTISPGWACNTVTDLTEWLLAHNYQVLLSQPSTLYEVQRAVIGITGNKCGISVPEIQLMDSFTNDLGMD